MGIYPSTSPDEYFIKDSFVEAQSKDGLPSKTINELREKEFNTRQSVSFQKEHLKKIQQIEMTNCSGKDAKISADKANQKYKDFKLGSNKSYSYKLDFTSPICKASAEYITKERAYDVVLANEINKTNSLETLTIAQSTDFARVNGFDDSILTALPIIAGFIFFSLFVMILSLAKSNNQYKDKNITKKVNTEKVIPEKTNVPKKLTFKSNQAAFEYACQYMDCGLKVDKILSGIVHETKTVLNESGTSQNALFYIASNAEIMLFACDVLSTVPPLQKGDLIAFKITEYYPLHKDSTLLKNIFPGSGEVIAKLKPVLNITTGIWEEYKQ